MRQPPKIPNPSWPRGRYEGEQSSHPDRHSRQAATQRGRDPYDQPGWRYREEGAGGGNPRGTYPEEGDYREGGAYPQYGPARASEFSRHGSDLNPESGAWYGQPSSDAHHYRAGQDNSSQEFERGYYFGNRDHYEPERDYSENRWRETYRGDQPISGDVGGAQTADPGGWQRGFGRDDYGTPQHRSGSVNENAPTSYGRSAHGRGRMTGHQPSFGEISRDRQGPKGYARSDERIQEFICERLAQYHWLDVRDVSVMVDKGQVTLEGTVPERPMKHEIEDIADSCWGVKDVANRLRVVQPGSANAEAGGGPTATLPTANIGGDAATDAPPKSSSDTTATTHKR